ncbi:NAD(P)-binding protein [Rhizodiscina lignyota]|uniref:NAD(P)-binding protein n=1 Tax=Rhizodiscina lignyota TaxID=1504668 RepID=A0A9P4I2F0_9PEZI|nr:NAD(P)-binding protein [Rhizodiscina lignyota]
MGKRTGPVAPGVAFVTGGARGLGNAIAVSFAREGARGIVIVDVNNEETMKEGVKAIEGQGTECLAIRADVTKEEEIERAVAQAVERFGRIDYAANFAGILGPGQRVADSDYSQWQKTMSVNCDGVMLSMKYEMRQMMKQSSIEVEEGRVPQQGSIVNAASVNSLLSTHGTVAYTAAKHAVGGMTKTAALEGRQHNIRVNAVSPGFLPTKLLDPVINRPGGAERWAKFEARQGRAVTGFDEVGDVVVLLSTPRMSLVNGQNLSIDNGYVINEGVDW